MEPNDIICVDSSVNRDINGKESNPIYIPDGENVSGGDVTMSDSNEGLVVVNSVTTPSRNKGKQKAGSSNRRISFPADEEITDFPINHPLSSLMDKNLCYFIRDDSEILCSRCHSRFSRNTSDGASKYYRLRCTRTLSDGSKCNNSVSLAWLKAFLIDLYDHNCLDIKYDGQEPFICFGNKRKTDWVHLIYHPLPGKKNLDQNSPPDLHVYKGISSKYSNTLVTPMVLRSLLHCKYDYLSLDSSMLQTRAIFDKSSPSSVYSSSRSTSGINQKTEAALNKVIGMLNSSQSGLPTPPKTPELPKKRKLDASKTSSSLPLEDDSSPTNLSPPTNVASVSVEEFNLLRNENYNLKLAMARLESQLAKIISILTPAQRQSTDAGSHQVPKSDSSTSKVSSTQPISTGNTPGKSNSKPKIPKTINILDKINQNINQNKTIINNNVNKVINKLNKTTVTYADIATRAVANGESNRFQCIKKIAEAKHLSGEKASNFVKGSLVLAARPAASFRPTDLKAVYIQGIYRKPISVIRKSLANIGIQVWRIPNISFVGNNICELLVHTKYVADFTKILSEISLLKILGDEYSPSACGREDATDQEKKLIESSFRNRLTNIINRKNAPKGVKDFFSGLLASTEFKYPSEKKDSQTQSESRPPVAGSSNLESTSRAVSGNINTSNSFDALSNEDSSTNFGPGKLISEEDMDIESTTIN